ncbi:pentapeptide repeat-containing protein [Nonomuraea sp. JJY05]|uniref:pentapeptide repeat-containing protein n=1 Tax=Nonomuraea sp. JJY05 TaxID=3350255 RepID=UPI00373F574E
MGTGQETLRATQQQQITDRYTKAVEQIGSDKSVEVRVGGLYALERIAKDSPADAATIAQVMVAFILGHDREGETKASPSPTSPKSGSTPLWRPGADVSTAARVLGILKAPGLPERSLSTADFAGADWARVDLQHAYLPNVSLSGADLTAADLTGTNLSGANLISADLSVASLQTANLANAGLKGTKFFSADLKHADLTNANLNAADLTFADLKDANLTDAFLLEATLGATNLRGADLTGANLTGADLTGADLRDVKGITPEQVRKVAITDKDTHF